MAFRTRVIRGQRRQIRESLWFEISTVQATLAGAPTAVLSNSFNAGVLALRPFTIVRTRGILACRSDQTAASETFAVDLGFAVVSDQAVAIGVTAVPTPLTDKGSDLFFVYEQLFGHLSVGAGSGTGPATSGSWAFMKFDSKAMRKVNEGSDVAVTMENEIAGAIAFISGRMLIKLH